MAFMQRISSLVAMTAMLSAGIPAIGAASPLDEQECHALQADYKALLGQGIEVEMALGPDWAKANLTEEALDRIKRFLTMEDDIAFRCPGMSLPESPTARTAANPPGNPTVPMPERRPQPPLSKPGKSAGLQSSHTSSD